MGRCPGTGMFRVGFAPRDSDLDIRAQYPGPAIAKVTKLWCFWKTAQGYKYLWHKELHDQYGPYVRTGPNEISVIDAPLYVRF
ncbi:hypothetical protein C8R45DRAFT_516358 [Mycena sanguinolenta]|nr:hypothetical protein C8R45DRAFT_516358 [Mycena sanguinolenta]